MAVDTPDVKKAEEVVAEAPKNGTAEVIESTRKGLHLQRLLSLTPEKEVALPLYKIQETQDKSKEVQTFSKQEILEATVDALELRKLNADKVKITRIVHNEKGDIVTLDAQIPNENNDGGYTEITYTLQGVHSKNLVSPTTNISLSTFDMDGMPDTAGEIINELVDGKWLLDPNKTWVIRDSKGEVSQTAEMGSDGIAIVTPKKD